VYRGGHLGARLLVGQDEILDKYDRNPNLRRIAIWNPVSRATLERYEQTKARLDAQRAARTIDVAAWARLGQQARSDVRRESGSVIAYRVAVYLET
jgi:hypothetical protein